MPEQVMSPSRVPVRLLCALLGLATFALYLPTAWYGFVSLDDPYYLVDNPMISSGLTWEGVRYAFSLEFWVWHPLAFLAHMVDVELFGLNPSGHHLMSNAWHALNAALLGLALHRLTGAAWRSLAVAALFALHPLRVESVAWVTERKDVMSVAFALLAILCYARYAGTGTRRRGLWYGWMLAAYALSLMSKAMFVTLPFALLLLDIWPMRRAELLSVGSATQAEPRALGERVFRRSSLPWLLVEKLPLLALALGAAVLTMACEGIDHAAASARRPWGLRASTFAVTVPRYVLDTVWPWGTGGYYFQRPSWPLAQIVGGVGMLVGFTLAAWLLRRGRPWLLVGWLFFLGTLAPVSGFVPFSGVSHADRFIYAPSWGLLLAGVWSWPACAGRTLRGRRITGALLLAACSALAALTLEQLPHWRDAVSLARRNLAAERHRPEEARLQLAQALYNQKRVEESVRELRALIAADPGHPDALYMLAALIRETDTPQARSEAGQIYETLLRVAPHHAMGLNDLGIMRYREGRREEGLALLRRAVAAAGKRFAPFDNLGRVLVEAKQAGEGAELLRQAVLRRPGDPEVRATAGYALIKAGRLADAQAMLEESLRRWPRHGPTHAQLVTLRSAQGREIDAARHAELRLEIGPDDAGIRLIAARLLERGGDRARAILHTRRALELAPRHVEASLLLARLLRVTGDHLQAMAQFARTVELDPQHVVARFEYALALERSGTLAEAQEHLKSAIALNPDMQQLHEALQRVEAAMRDERP